MTTKNGAVMSKSSESETVKRKPGRPRASQRPIGPAEQQQIASLYLRGWPATKIAVGLGVTERTVRHHLERNIRPIWRESPHADLEEDLRKVARIEEAARVTFRQTRDPRHLRHVKWAIEYRAKVFGHYASSRRKRGSHGEVRIGGRTPEQIDEDLLARILRRIADCRKRQRMLGAWN